MPTSATGRFESRPGRLRPAGFTLIEILVVMVILGLLAVSVSLTLPDPARQAANDAVQAWRRQAELAARLAEARATPIAWEIGAGQSRLLQLHDRVWLPLAERDLDNAAHAPALPAGLSIRQVDIDGQGMPCNPCAAQQVIFLPGEAPLFRVQLADASRRWSIEGLPNGRIALSEQP